MNILTCSLTRARSVQLKNEQKKHIYPQKWIDLKWKLLSYGTNHPVWVTVWNIQYSEFFSARVLLSAEKAALCTGSNRFSAYLVVFLLKYTESKAFHVSPEQKLSCGKDFIQNAIFKASNPLPETSKIPTSNRHLNIRINILTSGHPSFKCTTW